MSLFLNRPRIILQLRLLKEDFFAFQLICCASYCVDSCLFANFVNAWYSDSVNELCTLDISVEKLDRLTSTIKAQLYYCYYNLGKTFVIEALTQHYRNWHEWHLNLGLSESKFFLEFGIVAVLDHSATTPGLTLV